MKTHVDGDLRAVIDLLKALTDQDTMESGQKEAVVRSLAKLRRALRSGDVKKVREAVAAVARVFVRHAAT